MANNATALRNLHHLHQSLSDLRNRLDRGPKQIAAHETNVARLTNALTQAQETAKKTHMAIDRKQLDLKSSENRIADWKAMLNACSTNKEYQILIDQIAAAEMANSVLEDEILDGLDKIEAAETQSVKAAHALAASQESLEKVRKQVATESEQIRMDIVKYEQELSVVERELPDEFKADYQRLVRAKGANGLAPVEDNVCSGCGHQITLNMQNELKLDKTIFCRTCGRLLYLPKE
ncbi:MAG: phospholipase [Pirellulales bacterium]|nr:phospholipase [Pirellulales bacterium]